jgi:hypothetical protein
MQERVKPKSPMVRKQVYITAEQGRRLKIHAAAAGIAEAVLIRAGIDKQLADASAADDRDWRDVFDDVSPTWAKRDDLHDALAKVRSRWNRKGEFIKPRGRDI